MILKLSVRELRGLLSSGSLPHGGVLGSVTHPVGDGKTKSTMTTTGGRPCFVGADGTLHQYGSDRDVDKKRIETLESVADFNERAFRSGAGVFAKDTTDWAKAKAEADREAVRSLYMESAEAQGGGRRHDRDRPAATPGMLRMMGFPTFCGEPVSAFPHDCPAAAFARGFSEAFRPWLDAFDRVCRETVTDRFEDGRALCMEAYEKSRSAAYVRLSVHDGGSTDGRRTVLGWCTYVPGWADVRPLVQREVDGAVRSLAGALPLSDADMSRVRDAVVMSDYGDIACPDEVYDGDGPMPEWERAERARSVARWMERWLGDFEGWFRKVEEGRMSGTGQNGPAGGMTIDAHPSRDGLRVRLMAHRGDGPAVYDEERALPERDEDLEDWEADFIKALVDNVERACPWCDVDGFLDGRSGPSGGDVSFGRHVDDDGDDGEGENADECGAGAADVTVEGGVKDRLESLKSSLWTRLGVLSDSVNGLLGLLDITRSLVVNMLRVGEGDDDKVVVLIQVRDKREDWVRSIDYDVSAKVDWKCGCGALADDLVSAWSRVVRDALFLDDWTGWRERGKDGISRTCVCVREAAMNDYEAIDEENAKKGMAGRKMDGVDNDACVQDYDIDDDRHLVRPDEADVQDHDFGDGGHDGIQCSGGVDPTASRTREAAVLLRERLRRFCRWAGGETSRTLEAPVMLSSYRADVVRSVIRDCKTRETLYDQVFPYCGGDPVETFVEYMRVMTENAVCRRLNLEPDGWTDGGRGDGKAPKRAEESADRMQGWLDGFAEWLRGRSPSRTVDIRAVPSRDGGSVRLMIHSVGKYGVNPDEDEEMAVYDEERPLPEDDGMTGDFEARFIAALIEMAHRHWRWDGEVGEYVSVKGDKCPFDGMVSFRLKEGDVDEGDEDE